MVERGPVSESAKEATRRVFTLARLVSESATGIAKEHSADPSTLALALMMAGYMLVRFSSEENDTERRFWDAARIAKEMFLASDPVMTSSPDRPAEGEGGSDE